MPLAAARVRAEEELHEAAERERQEAEAQRRHYDAPNGEDEDYGGLELELANDRFPALRFGNPTFSPFDWAYDNPTLRSPFEL